MFSSRGAAHRCALLIEPQALFGPYFVAMLERAGYAVTMAAKRPSVTAVRALAPAVVVFDAAHAPVAPLQTIRALRRAAPLALIVVYAVREESVWRALANSVGADIVMGACAQEHDLVAAVERPDASP